MAVAGKWEDLQGATLDESIVKALASSFGFPTMTPVQAAAIGPLLSSQDVCVDAETGSGKTLSFLVPIAQSLLFGRDTMRAREPSRNIRALVILPTRELARQVHTVARQLFSTLPGDVSPCSIVGGDATEGPRALDMRVVIATPGRLNAEMLAGNLRMSQLEFLIMDEADRLLDMGFDVTLTSILQRLPKQRRTGLYSATQTAGVDELARAGLRNPVRVAVTVRSANSSTTRKRSRTPASLSSHYIRVTSDDKLAALCALLAARRDDKLIVYFLTCASVHFHSMLPLQRMVERASGDNAGKPREFFALHGKMMQQKRTRNLRTFAQSTNGVLLCTDVAARGIDLPDVDAVVQFDVPQDPDVYVHRVGRTARLGRSGYALIMLAPSEDAYIEFLHLRNCPVTDIAGADKQVLGNAADALACFAATPAGDVAAADEASEERSGLRAEVDTLVRECTLADRAVLDASQKAFLSYIRGYKEHKCRFILKLEDVDLSAVSRAFHLLRMPKFYEFKKLRSNLEFKKDENVCVRDIAYKDKAQEQKRQRLISVAMEERKSGKTRGKKDKRKRDEKKKGKQGAKPKRREEEVEEEDFGYAAWQLRKKKRGKISEHDFDELTMPEDST